MPSSKNLKDELKGLGADVAKAFKDAAQSDEFKKLQKDLLSSIKVISSSVMQAASSAKKSPQAGKIKNRLGRLADIGKKEGAVQAQKAEKAAAAQLRRARAALRKLSSRMKHR